MVTTTVSTLRDARTVGPRVAVARLTTPVQLRIASVVIAVLALLAGFVAAVTVAERQSATSSAWRSSEPLLVTAQDIDTSLSDADTTAAASFLQANLEPAALQNQYQSDLGRAASDVAVAAQRAGSDPALATSLRTISTELPVYAGIIQQANVNERQAFYPLAAAYLSEANNLMRTSLLPAAAQVYGTEARRLQGDQNRAVSPWLAVLAIVALVALVGALIAAQYRLSRRFRRTWNVALLVATILVLVLGAWGIVALTIQGNGVSSAMADGSRPVSTFTQGRILALRARADDELTLLTRDSDATFKTDYATTAVALRSLLASRATPGVVTPTERAELASARSAFASYQRLHRQISKADQQGDLAEAVTLASGGTGNLLPAVSSSLDGALANGIQTSQTTFVSSTSTADADLDGLVWGLAVGSVLVGLLVLVGFQPRIEEYR
ncbi:MAG TPA: hypothetical protein VMP41_00190 [Acidimicrobiales bacterium]|nr:hypothetical protein [Acidimicrobiales bacterium]